MLSESLLVAALIAWAVHALRSPLIQDDFVDVKPACDAEGLEPASTRDTFARLTFEPVPNEQFERRTVINW